MQSTYQKAVSLKDPESPGSPSVQTAFFCIYELLRYFCSDAGLFTQYLCDLEFVFIHVFGHTKRILDIVVNVLTISVSYDTVCCACAKQIHSQCSHVRSIYTVFCCRSSTSLHVT